MKKSITFVFVCLFSAAFVFAMGQGDSSKADPNAPVTLSVYMQMDLANPQSAYWPETVAAFEKNI